MQCYAMRTDGAMLPNVKRVRREEQCLQLWG